MQNEVSFAPERQVKKGSFDRGPKLTKFILLPKSLISFRVKMVWFMRGKTKNRNKKTRVPCLDRKTC